MSPMWLTQLGRKAKYGELDDFSETGIRQQLDWRRQSVAAMKARIDLAKLDADARTSWDIWENELDRAEVRVKWLRHAYIFGFGGPHTELPNFLITYHKVQEPSDMEAYVARLGALGRAIDQHTERAKLAAGDGIRMPAFNYDKVAAEATMLVTGRPFSASGPDSPLREDAKAKIKGLVDAGKTTPEQAQRFEAAADAALTDRMKPAYERLIAWTQSDKANAKSGKVGALTLPDGAAWYDASLYMLTTTRMTAGEIHELGLKEVARIQAQMDTIRVSTGFKGDAKAFFEFMRTDPRFYEGIPGHHMQIAIQNELTDIPLFRTQYGYSAFSEGWGLYAEGLGKQMGSFTDPYNDFGRLSSELWRAVRLVLDTGLHAKGWTEEEAVAWALANSPRPETAVRSEVRRYLLWPGQATTYKIGMLKIQALRDQARAALGDRFDLRRFHDTVIGGGSMPLPVLEKRIAGWIEAQKAGQ